MANAQNYLSKKSSAPLSLLTFLLIGGFLAPKLEAQQSLPLLEKASLEYLGAFRLPRGGNGTANGFSFGGSAIAHDPSDNSLYILTRESWAGKVKIPTPVKSNDVNSLPFATIVQNIRDPLEGGRSVLPESGIRGLLVNTGKLYGTASIYYDANNSARVSHFSRPTDLTATGATPLKTLWQAEKSGYVAGWLANVPSEWRPILGGSILSGNCCVPIVSRTSFGPSAFAWNPSDFDKTPIPATPLLYYDGAHPTLGPWSGSNEVYGGTTVVGGMVIPDGTRSLLYFGLNGTGTYCYGTGGARGECIDPLSSDKGQHAYPYKNQVWAYDLNDLAAVKTGNKKPWEIRPYATWSLDDFPVVAVYGISGATYDPMNKIIYLSQLRADKDSYSSRALIHAYKINISNDASNTTPTPSLLLTGKLSSPNTPSQEVAGEAVSSSGSSRSGGGGGTATPPQTTKEALIMKIMLQLIILLQELMLKIKFGA